MCIYKREMARSLVCLRYFLVGCVILLGVCGTVAAAYAAFFIYQLHEFVLLTPTNVCGPPIIILATAAFTCIFCWCSWVFMDFTNKSQVITLSVLIGILTLVDTGGGIWALVRHEQIDALPRGIFEKIEILMVEDNKSMWDRMQSKLRCCGVDGPSDYHGLELIPWSCCDTSSLNSNNSKATCATIYARGCFHPMINRTRSILLHVFLVALCLVFVQLCVIICASCYIKSFNARLDGRKRSARLAQSYEQARDSDTNDKLIVGPTIYSKRSVAY